jgi:mRNA interferase RelE/StbE
VRSARKELEALPARLAERVLRRIERLSATPRPLGCRKLSGKEDLWRIRVSNLRVLYAIDDTRRLVDVIAIRDRRDV